MKLSPTAAIISSGAFWLIIGLFLLIKGLNLIVLATHAQHFAVKAALIPHLASWVGGIEQGALVLIAFGLLIGLVKGRFVLAKTVKRVVAHILSLAPAIKLNEIYTTRYLLLIACMVMLGVGIRFLGLPADIHGLIDVAIGSALINGAMVYFRFALFKTSR